MPQTHREKDLLQSREGTQEAKTFPGVDLFKRLVKVSQKGVSLKRMLVSFSLFSVLTLPTLSPSCREVNLFALPCTHGQDAVHWHRPQSKSLVSHGLKPPKTGATQLSLFKQLPQAFCPKTWAEQCTTPFSFWLWYLLQWDFFPLTSIQMSNCGAGFFLFWNFFDLFLYLIHLKFI